jgi:hypothetical protein
VIARAARLAALLALPALAAPLAVPALAAPLRHAPPRNQAAGARPLPPRPVPAALSEERGYVATILARPLFTRGRKPEREEGPAEASTDVERPRLSGILITPEGRRAIFAPTGGGKPLVLAEGAAVGGDRIRRIEAGRVILATEDGKTVPLTPAFDPNKAASTPLMPENRGAPFLPNGFRPGFPGQPPLPAPMPAALQQQRMMQQQPDFQDDETQDMQDDDTPPAPPARPRLPAGPQGEQ